MPWVCWSGRGEDTGQSKVLPARVSATICVTYSSSVAPKTCPLPSFIHPCTQLPRMQRAQPRSLPSLSPGELLMGPAPRNCLTRGPRRQPSYWAPGSLSQKQPLPGDHHKEIKVCSWCVPHPRPAVLSLGAAGPWRPPQPRTQSWGCSGLQVLFSAPRSGGQIQSPLGQWDGQLGGRTPGMTPTVTPFAAPQAGPGKRCPTLGRRPLPAPSLPDDASPIRGLP